MNTPDTINVACPAWCDEADNHDPWVSSKDGLTITRGHGGRVGTVDPHLGVYVMNDDHLRIDPHTSTMTLETVPAWIHLDAPSFAELTPDEARQFGALLLRAADLAEGRTPDIEPTVGGVQRVAEALGMTLAEMLTRLRATEPVVHENLNELVQRELRPALAGVGEGFDMDGLVQALRDAELIVWHDDRQGFELVKDETGITPGLADMVVQLDQ